MLGFLFLLPSVVLFLLPGYDTIQIISSHPQTSTIVPEGISFHIFSVFYFLYNKDLEVIIQDHALVLTGSPFTRKFVMKLSFNTSFPFTESPLLPSLPPKLFYSVQQAEVVNLSQLSLKEVNIFKDTLDMHIKRFKSP